ncbi:unnamed protein product [Closterium sp. NIES-65]|nr:unnamed protein product [Closterium sp. NIES-65]
MQQRASSSSDARDRATFTNRLDASASHRALALPSSTAIAAAPDAMHAGAVSGARTSTTSRGAANRSDSAGTLVDGSAARPRFAGRRRQPGTTRPGGHLFKSRRRRVLLLFVGAIAALTAFNVLLLRSRNSLRAADIRNYINEDLSDEPDGEGADNEESGSEDGRGGDSSSSWSWRWWSALSGTGGGQRRAREVKAYNNSDPEPDARISDADDQFIDATLPVDGAQPARTRSRDKAGGAGGGSAGESGVRVRLEDVLRFNVMGAGRRPASHPIHSPLSPSHLHPSCCPQVSFTLLSPRLPSSPFLSPPLPSSPLLSLPLPSSPLLFSPLPSSPPLSPPLPSSPLSSPPLPSSPLLSSPLPSSPLLSPPLPPSPPLSPPLPSSPLLSPPLPFPPLLSPRLPSSPLVSPHLPSSLLLSLCPLLAGQPLDASSIPTLATIAAPRAASRRTPCSAAATPGAPSIHDWRPSDWQPPSPSLQAPINPAHCHRLNLPHVTVRVENSTWVHETIIEGVHACHPCALSCAFTRARPLATHPDALLFEGVLPPAPSKPGHPLHVYMNLEAHPWGEPAPGDGGEGEKGETGKEGNGGAADGVGARAGVDVFVGFSANATVQATYAGHLFHWDRQRYIADNKRTDVPVFHAASNFVAWRDALVKALMKHVPMHSFGACRSTTALHGTELQLYPHCAHTYGAQERWQHHTHCVQSHYLFSLAIENTRAPGYVTEKFFYPLEAGTVPIYIGAPDIAAFAPPDSYIDASGLSPAELGAMVKRIAADPLEYMGYHAWRRCGVYGNYSRARQMSLDTLPCRLCEHISLMGGTHHHPRP